MYFRLKFHKQVPGYAFFFFFLKKKVELLTMKFCLKKILYFYTNHLLVFSKTLNIN